LIKRIVLLLALAAITTLMLAPTAQAQTECGWYEELPMSVYYCYDPYYGWWEEYNPMADIAMYRTHGYDAYDGDGIYYTASGWQPLSRWDNVCGHGLACS
jgi:hypothetical protein